MTSLAPTHSQTAVLGGGCFWCLEAVYQQVAGIESVVSGYAGGSLKNPTYEQVSTGVTGDAEVVQLTFDPTIITYADILDIFWTIHDPTTLDRQNYDVGTQYRSIILYADAEHEKIAQRSKAAVAKLWPSPIVTEIVPLNGFWPAEEDEQDYYFKHPDRAYCQIVINPKLAKLKAKFAHRLKASQQ